VDPAISTFSLCRLLSTNKHPRNALLQRGAGGREIRNATTVEILIRQRESFVGAGDGRGILLPGDGGAASVSRRGEREETLSGIKLIWS
jgi:hypothetical protein